MKMVALMVLREGSYPGMCAFVPGKEVEEGNMARAENEAKRCWLLFFLIARCTGCTYPVQEAHLGHRASISGIESMCEAHECIVVSKYQLVGSQ